MKGFIIRIIITIILGLMLLNGVQCKISIVSQDVNDVIKSEVKK